MADSRMNEEANCGFCWQRFEQMVDPRELPCHHVFCLGCLRGNFGNPTSVQCPVCKKTYDSLKIGSLPAASIDGKSAVSVTTSLTCDRAACQGQLAVRYCPDCSVKLCETHVQSHEVFFGEEHRVINIATYEDSPGKYKKPICENHKEVLIKACRKCDKLICNECDRQEGECAADSASHEFLTFSELKDETQSHYDKLVKAFSDKTADIYDLEKAERKELSEEEENCQKMLDGINKIRDKQIAEITEHAEKMKDKVRGHQKEVTAQSEGHIANLMSKIEDWKEFRTEVVRVLRDGHESEKIRQRRELSEKLESLLQAEPGRCEKKRKLALISKELQTNLNADVVQVPTSLTFQSAVDVGSACYSASHREDGNILVGSQDGAHLLNTETAELKKYESADKVVTSIEEHHQNVYILHEADGIDKVQMCLPDDSLTQRQQLFEFERSSLNSAALSVSDRYIAVTNSDTDTNELILYNFLSKQTKTVTPDLWPRALHFLPDGHLLAAGGDRLTKYRLENGELTEVWRCEGVEDGYGVSSGSDGLIYVNSDEHKTIYIISPEGKMLQKITDDKLISSAGYISVRGDSLAVPGWGDNTLYLFGINR